MAGEPLHPESLERIGRFKVRRYIAGGGMAWVFEVEDPGLFDARRALKLLKPGEADPETLRRFRREAELLSKLDHPHLVHIYEFGEDPGTGCQYYTMDFIAGRNLAQIHPDWLDGTPEGSTPADARSMAEIVRYFVEVLSALGRLHARGIVHRDIKPQNVFVDSHGRAVLGDLGVAKSSSVADETQKGVVPGTPLYMAPEQSLRFEASTRTDLFSLGLALYRVLTGRTVYDSALGADSTNSMAVLRHLWSLQGSSQEFAFDFPAPVPESLREVVRRACRMNPDDRFESAEAMSEALSTALAPARAAAASLAPPARALESPQRRAVGFGVVAAVGILVLGLAFWLGLGSYGRRTDARSARTAAEAAHAQVVALVGGLAGRAGDGANEAIDDARRRIQYAREEQNDADKALEATEYASALEHFARATDGYTRACQTLVDGWLKGLAQSEVEGARAALRSLSSPPQELVERANALGDPSTASGCSAAEAERARLFSAESLRAELAKRGGSAPPPATAAALAPAAAPAAATAAAPLPPVGAAPAVQPVPKDSKSPATDAHREDRRVIEELLQAWNRDINARNWSALPHVQKLRPGQLERYKADFAGKDVRQQLSIDFIAGFDTGKIDIQVTVTREEKSFFLWKTVARESRRAAIVRENGGWKIDGL
ncbi:MAG TPA: serine/threonine-protein kinase [Myxococcota bacterium]|nr:serine/threonine-protein kinase [Myxococcota bacterium]